ncbi:OmpP1/FadL family transporter [Parvicella tangerina]|uniref:Long-chain fatty acid transport protein n=1 Tax=Parvicella tangerina TaxID=2829795 RepID=A0A916JMP0_9FLAO|nr:outer membrane protein transport protein [Parvicella tangerina]CAG5082362.1 Long-chain fatty acid transport protein [Parvicella tangerina]
MRKGWSIIVLTFMSISAFGGGFQLNTQSVRALGLGGAFTAWANDPSALFFNPGAMYQVKGHHFIAGLHYVMPRVSLQTPSTDNINQTTPNANPIHFYYTGQLTDKLNVGFAVNNQFGSSSSFADNWEGRYIIQNISLRTFMFQPTVSYKIHEKLGIGAGFVFTTGAFSTEKAVPVSSADYKYGQAHLEGSGVAFGFNLGLHSKLIDNEKMVLALGLNYRSKLNVNLPEGKAEFYNIPSSLRYQFPESTTFSGGLTLPDVATGGLRFTYHLNDELDITALYDYSYTGWKSYDTLAFDFANPDTPDSETIKAWKSTGVHRVGLDVTFKERFSFRVGFYADKTPIPDGRVSPELPDADQANFTFGLGVQLTENIGFDVNFLRQNIEMEGSLDDAGFTAKYHRIVDVVGFAVNASFGGGQEEDDESKAKFE